MSKGNRTRKAREEQKTTLAQLLQKKEIQELVEVSARKRAAEISKAIVDECDAAVLWTLHTQFGYGPDRLKKFYATLSASYEQVFERYKPEGALTNAEQMEADATTDWFFRSQLKAAGVDLESWRTA